MTILLKALCVLSLVAAAIALSCYGEKHANRS